MDLQFDDFWPGGWIHRSLTGYAAGLEHQFAARVKPQRTGNGPHEGDRLGGGLLDR